MPGERDTERARLEARVRAVGDDDVRLRLPVPVVDGHAPGLLEHRDDVRLEVVTRGDEPAETAGLEALEVPTRQLGEGAVLGGRLAEDGHAEAVEEVELLLGVERALVQHELRATGPWAEQAGPDGLGRTGVRGAPDCVATRGVEPVLRLHAGREGRAVRVADEPLVAPWSRRREDEGDVTRGGVVRRRRGQRLRGAVESGVVHVLHLGGEGHLRQERVRRAVGDDERCTGRGYECLEGLRRAARRAGDCHDAGLDAAEDDLEPRCAAAEQDEHAVARPDVALAQERCPGRSTLGQLEERARLDDAVAPRVHQRAALRVLGERLDDVACEVEAVGDLPAVLDEGRHRRELERRARLGDLRATPTDAKPFHGNAHYRPVSAAEAGSCSPRSPRLSRYGPARPRTARPRAAARGAGSLPPARARRCASAWAGGC